MAKQQIVNADTPTRQQLIKALEDWAEELEDDDADQTRIDLLDEAANLIERQQATIYRLRDQLKARKNG